MKILVIEDDETTSRFVCRGLKEAGYLVQCAADGKSGLHLALGGDFDAIVLDIMLPGIDGFTIISRLREERVTTPLLVLSAKSSVSDRVKGLQIGGDDYLVKPFAFAELIARLQALLRRFSPGNPQNKLSVADLVMDLLTRKVFRGEVEIVLQPKEFALLEYLVRNKGLVVSKTMIMSNVWDYSFDPTSNVVETRICCLRDKIDRSFSPKLIHTVRGFGYILEER